MAIVPVRQVGRLGINKDVPPFDLPLGAWSGGRNVRFKNGVVERTDCYAKVITDANITSTPIGIATVLDTTADDLVIVVDDQFRMKETSGATTTDVTPLTHVNSPYDFQVTWCELGGMTYINCASEIPRSRQSEASATRFIDLPNWDSSWRCESLRAFKDFLIAINVTKGATVHKGMIKWSNATQGGTVPDTWDPAGVDSLAGENILNDISGSLIDGHPLRNDFIVFSRSQAYKMEYIGAPFVFSFTKIFDDDGVIAPNCAVEVNGLQYVFGENEIYAHDGFTKKSISEGSVRRFIFDNLNKEQQLRCFVTHNEKNHEIYFNFPSLASDCTVQGVSYCNCAAVYNYEQNTWSFVDLPNVTASGVGGTSVSRSWDSVTENWPDLDTSWRSLADVKKRTVLMAGAGYGTVSRAVYGLDKLIGGELSYPILSETLYTPFVERTYIDLDDLGIELEYNKLVRKILPQISSLEGDGSLTFEIGYTQNTGEDVVWGSPITFDPLTEHKIDQRSQQRYMSMRYTINGRTTATFSGFDMDVMPLSKR